MDHSFDIWKLLAGVAIFLLGMKFLEESIRQLSGRPFKLFLKKQTASKIKAIAGGTIVTGVLQSSSVVNLMVLAFVGANVIQMQNALAVILGANLGTTLNSWIVATAGFKLNIENIAFPVTGISGIVMSLTNKESKWHQWSKLLFGFSFLFVGLNYIKTGMEDWVKQVDLSSFNLYPAIAFVFIGLLITSLTQSSSATVAIVLSALHAGAINLFTATALVLGSEVGTTLKLVLASLNGLPVKKRVALGNLLFNSITVVVVFIFLSPINRFIKDAVHIKDNLYALVFFQSLINAAGIILFYPLLNTFGKFLESKFVSADEETNFIHKVNAKDTELALVALEKEVKNLLLNAVLFAERASGKTDNELEKLFPARNYNSKSLSEQYEYLKHLHGEIHTYASRVQQNTSDTAVIQRLEQLVAAGRNTMYASKSIKDAVADITQLRNSSNDSKYEFYRNAADKMEVFCRSITSLLLTEKQEKYFETLTELYRSVTENYPRILQQLYKENTHHHLSEVEISTLINFNREIYTAYKSYIFAARELLLDTKQAAYFDELPGFIR